MVSPRDAAVTGYAVPGDPPAAVAAYTASAAAQPVWRSSMAVSPDAERSLTETQVEAIGSAMRLFLEDDLARGVLRSSRAYCDGCERPRPAAGAIRYERYALCNSCAIEYEVGRARGLVANAGQYVRDKHFGEGDRYTLSN